VALTVRATEKTAAVSSAVPKVPRSKIGTRGMKLSAPYMRLRSSTTTSVPARTP
jgi:hypothetical protein